MPKTISTFVNLNSMRNYNFWGNRLLGTLYLSLRLGGFTNTYGGGSCSARAEHCSCIPSRDLQTESRAGEAASWGQVESPPVPNAAFPWSLLCRGRWRKHSRIRERSSAAGAAPCSSRVPGSPPLQRPRGSGASPGGHSTGSLMRGG